MKQLMIAFLATSAIFGQVPQFDPLLNDLTAPKSTGGASLATELACTTGTATTTACTPAGVAAAIAAQTITSPFPATLSGSNQVLNIGAGKYSVASTPYSALASTFTQAQPTIISATAANPMVIEVNADTVAQTLIIGMKMSVAGALGTGCSGMNSQFLVTNVANNGSAQRRVVTLNYNNTGCTYTANSAKFGANTSMSGVWVTCLTANQEVALITPVDMGVYITGTGPYLVRQTSSTPSCDISVTGEYGWKTLWAGTLSSTLNGSFTALDATMDKRAVIDLPGFTAGTGLVFDSSGGVVTLKLVDVPYLTGTNAFSGSNDFSGASLFNNRAGSSLPATCTANAGALFYKTAATKGLYRCDTTNTWTLDGGAATLTPRPIFWPFGTTMEATGSEAVGSANRTLYYGFDVPAEGITFSTIAMYISSGTGNISAEIMDSTCTKITNGNASTAVAPGFASIVLTMPATLTLTQGHYFFGFSSSQAGDAAFRVAGSYVGEFSNGLTGTSLNYFYGSNAASGANPNVLPTTCGTRTLNLISNSPPLVQFR